MFGLDTSQRDYLDRDIRIKAAIGQARWDALMKLSMHDRAASFTVLSKTAIERQLAKDLGEKASYYAALAKQHLIDLEENCWASFHRRFGYGR
jgi:hypothetical protein